MIGLCSHEGLQALYPGLVERQGHCSHQRARIPQHRASQVHPSPCVTEPMVGKAGNDNPSGCECYVGERQFCRGCRTRKGSSRLATIRVASWCGIGNTHGFGIFNGT